MSVVVALFWANGQRRTNNKRQKIIDREKFLRLSRLSYINSKIVFLFSLSAMQTLLFVLIGNAILEIKHMNFAYWLLLFTTACNANLMGLNISSGLKSLVAIYILIPLLLVPQMLLSGSIVKFDKLNKHFTNQEHVPIAGNIMVSRWMYEALLVHQFLYNDYKKHFVDIEKAESDLSYMSNYYLPEIESMLQDAYH
ncbi:MAG: ABC transporter permease [Bacteroidales bacterium]|nr:ABC transporter permease [Bacteroidales bacterium]